jgi:hypothetical protein
MNGDSDVREFHLGDIFSGLSEIEFSLRSDDALVNLTSFMIHDRPVCDHVADAMYETVHLHLQAQFPWLRVPDWLTAKCVGNPRRVSWANVWTWSYLDTLEQRYGAYHPVRRVPVEELPRHPFMLRTSDGYERLLNPQDIPDHLREYLRSLGYEI